MLGALMIVSKILMQAMPNIHLLGLFIAAITLTYRVRALIPLYVFVFLDGVYFGFTLWWIPYLYVWLPLWMMFMVAGKINIPPKARPPIYMILCALHGLSFGTLYAPAHAILFNLNFAGVMAWIIAGLPFDIAHAIGNLAAGTMIVPLAALLKRLNTSQ